MTVVPLSFVDQAMLRTALPPQAAVSRLLRHKSTDG